MIGNTLDTPNFYSSEEYWILSINVTIIALILVWVFRTVRFVYKRRSTNYRSSVPVSVSQSVQLGKLGFDSYEFEQMSRLDADRHIRLSKL